MLISERIDSAMTTDTELNQRRIRAEVRATDKIATQLPDYSVRDTIGKKGMCEKIHTGIIYQSSYTNDTATTSSCTTFENDEYRTDRTL